MNYSSKFYTSMRDLKAFSEQHRKPLIALSIGFALIIIAAATVYIHISRTLDARLAERQESAFLYSAPTVISVGDKISTEAILSELRLAGYADHPSNPIGFYRVQSDGIEITPGPRSYSPDNPVRILLKDGVVTQISAVKTGTAWNRYGLEPQPLGRVEDGIIEKHRPVQFREIPRVLVDALVSVEDKHFFEHSGYDPLRLLKAAWVNLKTGRKEQGGSTLTMQLARNLFLDSEKTWRRKAEELLLAAAMEVKLSKTTILEQYVNRVYLGRRNAISIHGFGQAAETYFSRPLADLTLPDAALLAGLVQRPSYFDPIRHPDRAIARRNLVLSLMQQNGHITEAERVRASQAPLSIAPADPTSTDYQWFIELAADELHNRGGREPRGRVYTTLDPGLQRAAAEAVDAGLRDVIKHAPKKTGHGLPEVALVAIDSHTGEVKALIGGRDFSRSEVNHATAQRQPGSVFKPFVYAAALQSRHGSFTAATVLSDDPVTFKFGYEEYTPGNYGHSDGQVTLRRALALSNNIASVSLAERVGYGDVLSLALASGFNDRMKATPSLALGSYESSPLEIAGAYTVFANGGKAVKPRFLAEVRDEKAAHAVQPETHVVLSPAVAFIMQDMLAEVIRSGTGWGVHAMGFNVPSAGKTGTSRDGWFAGYVSNLITVVWVGYDDNADLQMEGAKSALPIWTEFMKRASSRAGFRQPLGGTPPPGVTAVSIDAETGLLAGPRCVKVRYEYFLRGTEPKEICNHELALASDEGAPVIPGNVVAP